MKAEWLKYCPSQCQQFSYFVDLLRPYEPTIEELAIAYKNVWQSEQPYYKVNEARYALFDAIDRIPNV